MTALYNTSCRATPNDTTMLVHIKIISLDLLPISQDCNNHQKYNNTLSIISSSKTQLPYINNPNIHRPNPKIFQALTLELNFKPFAFRFWPQTKVNTASAYWHFISTILNLIWIPQNNYISQFRVWTKCPPMDPQTDWLTIFPRSSNLVLQL